MPSCRKIFDCSPIKGTQSELHSFSCSVNPQLYPSVHFLASANSEVIGKFNSVKTKYLLVNEIKKNLLTKREVSFLFKCLAFYASTG